MIFKLAFQNLLAVLYWTKLGNVLNKYILHAKMCKLSGKRLMFQSFSFKKSIIYEFVNMTLERNTSEFAFFTFSPFQSSRSKCLLGLFNKNICKTVHTHIQTIYICEGGFAWCGSRLKSDVGRFCINVPLGI